MRTEGLACVGGKKGKWQMICKPIRKIGRYLVVAEVSIMVVLLPNCIVGVGSTPGCTQKEWENPQVW